MNNSVLNFVLTELVEEIHKTAREKGWWDEDRLGQRSALEIHALIHSEISEATECVRRKHPPFFTIPAEIGKKDSNKPEGEAIELIDAVIRVMDYFGFKEWNFAELLEMKMKYNETRSHRHGGKAF